MQIIDVGELIKAKSGKKPSRIFVYLLRKFLCVDRINSIIEKYAGKQGVDFAESVLQELHIETSFIGLDRLPTNERFVFVSNHPLGALEALTIGKYLSFLYPNRIKFITNELLSYIPPLRDIFVSVAVGKGRQDKNKVLGIDKLFLSENQIVMFPSGVVSRLTDEGIQDPEWKKMFSKKARQYSRRVVLLRSSGRCSKFFLSLSNFRKRIGIKSNIEMLLFPREMFSMQGSKIDIEVLGVFDLNSAEFSGYSDSQIAQMLREKIYCKK